MTLKSRSELDSEVTPLLVGKNQEKVSALMMRHYRVSRFAQLETWQYAEFIEILKDAIYKGLV